MPGILRENVTDGVREGPNSRSSKASNVLRDAPVVPSEAPFSSSPGVSPASVGTDAARLLSRFRAYPADPSPVTVQSAAVSGDGGATNPQSTSRASGFFAALGLQTAARSLGLRKLRPSFLDMDSLRHASVG